MMSHHYQKTSSPPPPKQCSFSIISLVQHFKGGYLAGELSQIAVLGDMIAQEDDLGKAVTTHAAHVLLLRIREVGLHVQPQVLLSKELLSTFLQ